MCSWALRDLFRCNDYSKNLYTMGSSQSPCEVTLSRSGLQKILGVFFLTWWCRGGWLASVAKRQLRTAAVLWGSEQSGAVKGIYEKGGLAVQILMAFGRWSPVQCQGQHKAIRLPVCKVCVWTLQEKLGLMLFPLPQIQAWWIQKSHICYKSSLIMSVFPSCYVRSTSDITA